jgi:hypothetical protein
VITTLKIPPSKAWRRASQRIASHPVYRIPCIAAHCIANNPHTVQRSAAYFIATSSQRIGPRIASRASQRIASHPVHRSAPRECNQPARSALHRKQSAHRAAHHPHRQPACRASPAAHGAHLAPAALHALGGQNVLNSTLNMTYENFLQQVNLAEQLTSSDFGVSTGLISQQYWEQSKWYFVNVERGNIADKLQPRNINVSFTNNSNVNIDVIIFTFYSDQLTIDVETGIVTK